MKAMLKSLVSMFVEFYLRDALNGLLKLISNKADLSEINAMIQKYSEKVQSILAYLQTLGNKVSDGELSEEELTQLQDDGKKLIKDVLKK